MEFFKWRKMRSRWNSSIYKIFARWRHSKFQFQRISIPTNRRRGSSWNIQSNRFLLGSSLSRRWHFKCLYHRMLWKLKPEVIPEVAALTFLNKIIRWNFDLFSELGHCRSNEVNSFELLTVGLKIILWKVSKNGKNFQTNHLQSEKSSSLTYPRFLRRKRIPVDVAGAADFE